MASALTTGARSFEATRMSSRVARDPPNRAIARTASRRTTGSTSSRAATQMPSASGSVGAFERPAARALGSPDASACLSSASLNSRASGSSPLGMLGRAYVPHPGEASAEGAESCCDFGPNPLADPRGSRRIHGRLRPLAARCPADAMPLRRRRPPGRPGRSETLVGVA